METLFADGGHYFAWGYGTGQEYGSVNFERIWHTATGQFLGYSYLEQVPYFYLYGTDSTPADDQKVGSVLNFGDSWSDQPRGQEMLCYSAYSANVSLTQGYIDNYFANRSEICLPRLLMKRNGSGSRNPNGLPLAHKFSKSGFVMARDTWSGWPNGNPTILVFKSTPFYTGNHQHYDQNSFTLNYQGRLLIDSGVYDKYGSDHWRRYYTQTVAHNTLVIDNSSAKDRGQKNANPEPSTLSELNGKYRLDGITNFAQANWGCWMQGNASKAYDSSLLTMFVRDILMVYQPAGLSHPVMLVVDRVKLPTAQTPKLLWHTPTNCAPSLQGQSAAVYNPKGGHARLDFLAPAGLKLNLVQGAKVNGTAWEYDPNNLNTTGYHDFEPGWGRIEVATGAAVTAANFVTLITVDNTAIDTGGKLISGPNWLGAKYGNTLLIIGDSNNPPTEIRVNTTDATGVTAAYVAGVNRASVNISGIASAIVNFF
jgi:hypothetical protein